MKQMEFFQDLMNWMKRHRQMNRQMMELKQM